MEQRDTLTEQPVVQLTAQAVVKDVDAFAIIWTAEQSV